MKMTNQKPPVDLEPIAKTAMCFGLYALIGFVAWLVFR